MPRAKSPADLTYASSGLGSPQHLTAARFSQIEKGWRWSTSPTRAADRPWPICWAARWI